MSTVASRSRWLRGVALFALGALAVHQARYGLAIAAGAHDAAGGHRHAYLELLVPALITAAGAAISVSLLFAALRRRLPVRRREIGVTERAALYAAGLIAVYFVQELAEALLAGDPAALAAAFGPGGWLVVPLAMAFGAGAALAGRALDRAEVCLARRMHQRPRRAPRSVARPRLVLAPNLASRTLAFGLARRPPPSLALTG